MFRTLRLEFQSLEQFQDQYQAYRSHGQLFVPSRDRFGLREVVDLHLSLGFCSRVITVQAEVHGFRNWANPASPPGVSVQLVEPIENLRLAVADATGIMLGPDEAPKPAEIAAKPTTREAERSIARVTVALAGGGRSSEGRTQDLSLTGALVVVEDVRPDIGATLEMTMFHPTTDRTHKFRAEVVRHADLPSGDVGIGVRFDFSDGSADVAHEFLHEVRAIELDPVRRTETITGSIDVLGLATLLQMFAASVSEGTVTLVRGQDRGRIVFCGGMLSYARTGDVEGLKAVCRLLAWKSGVFHFAPVADDQPEDIESGILVHRALFESIQKLDELACIDTSGFPRDQRVVRTSEPQAGIDDLEAEVLDFIKQGATVGEVIDGIATFDVDVYVTLEKLLELGLIDLEV